MKMIERPLYLKRLVSLMDTGVVKVIGGLRGVGKTHLLFHDFRGYLLSKGVKESQIIAIRLEEKEHRRLRDVDCLYEYITSRLSKDEMNYVFIDEAGLAISKKEAKDERAFIGLYAVLNSLLGFQNVDTYITTSNARFLYEDVRTEFRGRSMGIRIPPLSFSEFMNVYRGSESAGFEEYLKYGGMPYAVGLNSPEEKEEYLKSLIEDVYIPDLSKRHELRSGNSLAPLMEELASSVGTLTVPRKLSNDLRSRGFKAADKTVDGYLGYLENAFLISKASHKNLKWNRCVESGKKYYIEDLGLLNALLGFEAQNQNALMENAVYNEMKARRYAVDIGFVQKREWQDGRLLSVRKDIGFVCEGFSGRVYVRLAESLQDRDDEEREKALYRLIGDSFPKIILSKYPCYGGYDTEGNIVINIADFLLGRKR